MARQYTVEQKKEDQLLESILEKLETFDATLWKPTDFFAYCEDGNMCVSGNNDYGLRMGNFSFAISEQLVMYITQSIDFDPNIFVSEYYIRIYSNNTKLFRRLTNSNMETDKSLISKAAKLYFKIYNAKQEETRRFVSEREAMQEYDQKVEQGRQDLLKYLDS